MANTKTIVKLFDLIYLPVYCIIDMSTNTDRICVHGLILFNK